MTYSGSHVPRALRVAQRMDALGVPINELARLAKVDRQAVTRAREGSARPATYGKIERALEALERTAGMDEPDEHVAVVDYPDGTRVTYRGASAEQLADFVKELLDDRNETP